MRIGYIECFSGISGDMLLAALVDAGVPLSRLEETVAALNIGATLRLSRVDRSGIHSAKMDVLVDGRLADAIADEGISKSPTETHVHAHSHSHEPGEDEHEQEHSHSHEHAISDQPHSHVGENHTHDHSHVGEEGRIHSHEAAHTHQHEPHTHDHAHTHTLGRNWPQIRALIEAAGLPARASQLALKTFELLAHAEARIHNVPVDTVHFHEVGAVDTIVDIVCNAVGLTYLDVDRWVCSPINTGSGFVQCAHGLFPVPAPATAALLLGAPTYSSGIQMELVTPTGAALLRALECEFADTPRMRAATIGYGAGSKNPKRFPNVVRLTLGESDEGSPISAGSVSAEAFPSETVSVLECAIDDMQPQLIAHTMDLLLQEGALDVMAASVLMKKNRMGTLLTVLCRSEKNLPLQQLLFRETTTLGIRTREESRVVLDRRHVAVATVYGEIRVKLGTLRDETWNAMPEYEDCLRASDEHHVPIKLVMQAALAGLHEAAPSLGFSEQVKA